MCFMNYIYLIMFFFCIYVLSQIIIIITANSQIWRLQWFFWLYWFWSLDSANVDDWVYDLPRTKMLFAKEDWIYPNFLKLIMYVKSAIPCSEKLESMNYAGKDSIFLAEMEINFFKWGKNSWNWSCTICNKMCKI